VTVRQALEINAALQATGCQPGVVIRDGSKESAICKVFDYVSDKGKIGFSRQIADWEAAVKDAADAYNKANNQRVAAFDDKSNNGRYRNKDGELTQEAISQLAVWRDAYLEGDAFLGGRVPPPRFKRSDLEAVGFQPPLLAALRPITDVDNADSK
jgi:hypothetical protein